MFCGLIGGCIQNGKTWTEMANESDIFYEQKDGRLYYCGIPLSDSLPSTANSKHQRLKDKVRRKQIVDWSTLKIPEDSLTFIPNHLFFTNPQLKKSCGFCNHNKIVLTHVKQLADGSLFGIATCSYCGAKTETAILPTPKRVADVVARLSAMGYSATQIAESLQQCDVSITVTTARKIILAMSHTIQPNTLIPVDVIRQVARGLD